MTDDQTKCPHCGADLKCRWAGKDMYECATIVEYGVTLCRDVVCLTRELDKAKELLKEVLACGCSWECAGKYAELQIPLNLIEDIRKVVVE